MALSIGGLLAMILASTVKTKSMGLILAFVFLGNFLVATSYLLDGNNNGAACCYIGAAQALINFFFEKNKKPIPMWLVGIYAIAIVAINVTVMAELLDLLAIIASLTFIMCIGQKNGKTYRIWTFINTALWLSYDLLQPHTAYGPALTHTIQLCIVISGIAIHDVKINKLFKRK